MSIVPAARPKLSRGAAEFILASKQVAAEVVLLGMRGYYRDSMGKVGENDRGLYDDAIFLLSRESFTAFNANVDPSAYRRGIATLKPGVWKYKVGIHGLSKPKAQRYEALVQAGPVTVMRDGQGEDTGMFGINIHRGGLHGTSSLGCQTIVPAQWAAFMALVKQELKRAGQTVLPYVLVEQAG
jgi:hypothetical protein